MTQHEDLQEDRARKCTRTVRHTGYDYSASIIIISCTKHSPPGVL